MKFPKTVILELTYRCNHKCLFCSCPWESKFSTYNKGPELSVSEWKNAIDRMVFSGMEFFSISGGEAILKEGAKDIIRHIRDVQPAAHRANEIVLISNGRSLTKEWLAFFKENNVHLSISLPGIETFQRHTGVNNVDGVLNWFKEAKAIGLKTTANITVTALNLHELEKNIALALLSGANDILLNRFLPGGRGLSHIKELALTTSQINDMLEVAERVLSYANRYGNIGTEIPLCSIDDPSKYKFLNIGYKCAAATGFFVVGPSGEIRTCNHSPKIVGNIFDKYVITDRDYWNLFTDETLNIPVCKGCIARPICSCGCREVASIMTSSLHESDPSIKLRHQNLYK